MAHAIVPPRQRGAARRLRRQMPLGPYIVDFVANSHRLVIEVDGGQHGTDAGLARDRVRDVWLDARGYRVLRFWNGEVLANLEGTLTVIADALAGRGPAHDETTL